ncbi:conserved hypothetical protein [Tenacibaculum sp. 190524A02b]|uniref:Beta-lactamase-inhibitor-like PepSY-like domain-containing protein n=1 Tax=Tenacibaculum vairaonense TaxID=3137860 RepID=A0ABP1FDX0_9FLAO
MRNTLFITLLLYTCFSFCQVKYEREYRVSQEEAPLKSIETIKNLGYKKKIKWYAEESQDGKTYEAKSYYKGRKHSCEFTEKGELIDIEIKVNFKLLSQKTQQIIKNVLFKKFKKIKIKKTQIQFKPQKTTSLNTLIKSDDITILEQLATNYELIIKGKTSNGYSKYEFLISNKGELIKELKFTPSNSDNLEF